MPATLTILNTLIDLSKALIWESVRIWCDKNTWLSPRVRRSNRFIFVMTVCYFMLGWAILEKRTTATDVATNFFKCMFMPIGIPYWMLAINIQNALYYFKRSIWHSGRRIYDKNTYHPNPNGYMKSLLLINFRITSSIAFMIWTRTYRHSRWKTMQKWRRQQSYLSPCVLSRRESLSA